MPDRSAAYHRRPEVKACWRCGMPVHERRAELCLLGFSNPVRAYICPRCQNKIMSNLVDPTAVLKSMPPKAMGKNWVTIKGFNDAEG